MSDTVTLTHPDGHGPIERSERTARILVRQGWQYADDAQTPTPPGDGDPPPPLSGAVQAPPFVPPED